MATSLSQQLKRLAVPQTSITLADARSRASIIFDPKEAATKDRQTIFKISISGLKELISLNSDFKQFEKTLFNEASIHLERAVEHKDVNELLNKNIAKFLQHLSPYLLLRPAHLCFEWLLRRFQVHEYNRREVFALILPYHETNIFVKILQTMRIRRADDEWQWLRPMEKMGVPIPKSAILNRAASDPAFLQFVCQSTLQAVKELGSQAHLLQAQINFYTIVVVGALQNAKHVQEWHITMLLEPLLKGLGSSTLDFVASAYIIVAQIVTVTKLKPKLCNAFVERVANCSFERLRETALLLLISIFDTQVEAKLRFKPETLLNLIRQKWLTTTLASFAKENIATQALCTPLMKGSVKAILEKDPESLSFKMFLERLLFDIEFSKSSAQNYISNFLDAFKMPERNENMVKPSSRASDNNVIELDSDEDMIDVSTDFQSWYSDYLFKLERQYPEAFDEAIKLALQKKDNTSDRSQAVKMAIAFRLQLNDENSTNIYECLYHYNPEIRFEAVKTLLTNLTNYQSHKQNYHLLKESLADRINDENQQIVRVMLGLNTKDFIDILGIESFIESLFRILNKAQLDARSWGPLIGRVVQHLTATDVQKIYDNHLILLALMPILFPEEQSHHGHSALLHIVHSGFAKKVHFLQALQISERYADFDVSSYKQNFLETISQTTESLDPIALLRSIEERGGNEYLKQAVQVTHLLLLLTACLKKEISTTQSLQILKQVVGYTSKRFKFMHIEKKQMIDATTNIPLQLYMDFLVQLVKHTQFGDLSQWTSNSGDIHCALYFLDTVSEPIFQENTNAEVQLQWMNTLKECLDCILPTAQLKFDFLLNFCLYETLPWFYSNANQNFDELRVRGFKILQAVLRNKNNKIDINIAHILRVTCALTSPSPTLRLQTLETLEELAKRSDELEKYLMYFVKCTLERRIELGMDHEQFALILYTILRPGKVPQHIKLQANKLQREILQIICDETQPIDFTAALLKSFKHVNDTATLGSLLPLAMTCLQSTSNDDNVKQIRTPYSDIYLMIAQRLDYQIVSELLVTERKAWEFFEISFASHDVYIMFDGKLQPIPCVILDTLTAETYNELTENFKNKFLELVIKTVAKSNNDSIFLSAHKLLKKCTLDCKPFISIIGDMCTKCIRTPAKTKNRKQPIGTVNQIDLASTTWKEGIAFLELLENKKHLSHSESLIPQLFELLKTCLELEDHSTLEYPKQLILSTILHCCQSSKVVLQSVLPEFSFRIDQVVQCLRATQNPQTQQVAQLLLTHCASIYPQQVLHNIVAIFTFMGSSVVRHDDAFSFHIINNIIESIVPILIKQGVEKSDKLIIPVLKVFSDIMIDVPEHRRLPLYTKFLRTLGPAEHLWQFLCVVFESQVLEHVKKKSKTKNAQITSTSSQRLEVALQVANSFEPEIVVKTCEQLLDYLAQLSITGDEKSSTSTTTTKTKNSIDSTEVTLFDVRSRSATQQRHYNYIIMQFLSSISSSTEFLLKIKKLTEDEVLKMKPHYQNFIIKALSYVAKINETLKVTTAQQLVKFWKVILHHIHDVLDNAISLLSPEMFLLVVNSLMQHELLSVRKKVIELLITKLQKENSYFDNCAAEHFEHLFQPLADIVESIIKPANKGNSTGAGNNEIVYVQQTALIAIKLLSKLFALEYKDQFKSFLVTLTEITKERATISDVVVANVVLTLIEVSSNLKAHSLAQLHKYMPHVIKILKDQVEHIQLKAPDNICLAIVAGVQKLFEALPLFMGPYIVNIITALTSISTHLAQSPHAIAKEQNAAALQQKITIIWSKIATEVPVRILVPSCRKVYEKLLASQSHDDINEVMCLLLASIKHNNTSELIGVHSELSDLFMLALEFRLHMLEGKDKLKKERIADIETHIIDAFVAWILKLSESTFRPMYYRVYEWAIKLTGQKESILTYFLLTNKLAESLKSLFVLFANDFIADAARLLNESNTLKQPIASEEAYIHTELIKAILGTLYHVFLHDSNNFINSHRFETLAQPIVDHLENELVLQNETLQEILTSSIAQLAVAVSNDVHWKQLNNQVLLKTRSTEPETRINAFNCCVEIARKLGDDFSPLLPETVPFIAELLEDENSRVEKYTRKSVQELEQILGESLQKYL